MYLNTLYNVHAKQGQEINIKSIIYIRKGIFNTGQTIDTILALISDEGE